MTLGFDIPECPPSFLKRIDPRWKLATVLLVVVAIALLRTLGPALAALAGAGLLVALTRMPLGWFLRRLASAMTMYLLFLIWLPLFPGEGDATFDLGIWTLSLTGLLRLILLGAKLASMIALMLVLLASTPLPNIFKAARALMLPRVLVFLLLMTYRYVGLLVEEFARLRTALRVRGFRNRTNLHSYRTIGQVAGTLLVRSHERSERVGQAMGCRGFDGEFRSLSEFRTSRLDVLIFTTVVGAIIALGAWEWLVA